MSADTTQPRISNDTQLEALLAAGLPGLSDEELRGLVLQVYSELELRVGSKLSAGLTEAQLTEFEQLVDAGDSAACTRWLQANRPDHPAIASATCADVVAEVVRNVTAADPNAARGHRRVGQVHDASMDLVQRHFTEHDVECTVDDERLSAKFQRRGSAIGVTINLLDHDLFTFIGMNGAMFPLADQTRLQAFAARWNHATWLPKSLVTVDEDEGTCQVVGEIAVPAGGRVTRAFVDAMVITCVQSMFKLFAAVDEELGGDTTAAGAGAGSDAGPAQRSHHQMRTHHDRGGAGG